MMLPLRSSLLTLNDPAELLCRIRHYPDRMSSAIILEGRLADAPSLPPDLETSRPTS